MRTQTSGPEQSRVEAPRDRKGLILDAAADAFMEFGFHGTSIDAIADRLDLTKGSIYYYFRSKMNLFSAVHDNALSSVTARVKGEAENTCGDNESRLYRMVYQHALCMMEETSYQRVTVQGVDLYQTATTSRDRQQLESIIERRAEYEELFIDSVTRVFRDRGGEDGDPRLAVRVLLGSLNWITLWYRPRPYDTPTVLSQMAEAIARQCLYGLFCNESSKLQGKGSAAK